MFGVRATCFRDFNTKNTNPWYDDEVWMQNSVLYLPIHRKCQIWPWFREYNQSSEHLEPPAWSLDTLYDAHDRIQPIMRPWINSTNKTNQIIANVEILRPNPPITRPETTGRKLSAKMLLHMVLDDGSSLFQWLERNLGHLVQSKVCVFLVRASDFTLGVHYWLDFGGHACALMATWWQVTQKRSLLVQSPREWPKMQKRNWVDQMPNPATLSGATRSSANVRGVFIEKARWFCRRKRETKK